MNSPFKPLQSRISDFGILYIATGDQYFLEACRSAEITSKYSPGVPISLLTDKHRPDVSNVFDVVDILPNPSFGYRDKVSGLGIFDKYEATLFLDTDAFAISCDCFWLGGKLDCSLQKMIDKQVKVCFNTN